MNFWKIIILSSIKYCTMWNKNIARSYSILQKVQKVLHILNKIIAHTVYQRVVEAGWKCPGLFRLDYDGLYLGQSRFIQPVCRRKKPCVVSLLGAPLVDKLVTEWAVQCYHIVMKWVGFTHKCSSLWTTLWSSSFSSRLPEYRVQSTAQDRSLPVQL